jgi:hypothetical protein
LTDLDRLHETIDALPPEQVRALLNLLVPRQPISAEEFSRRLAEAPRDRVDEETIARILAAEVEEGESISHGELAEHEACVMSGERANVPLSSAHRVAAKVLM